MLNLRGILYDYNNSLCNYCSLSFIQMVHAKVQRCLCISIFENAGLEHIIFIIRELVDLPGFSLRPTPLGFAYLYSSSCSLEVIDL